MDKEDKVDSVVCMYVYIDTYTHTHTCTHNWILFSHEEEWYSAICENMNRPGGCYAKWLERQILHGIIHMWI